MCDHSCQVRPISRGGSQRMTGRGLRLTPGVRATSMLRLVVGSGCLTEDQLSVICKSCASGTSAASSWQNVAKRGQS